MQIFSLSSLFPNYTHIHHRFFKLVLARYCKVYNENPSEKHPPPPSFPSKNSKPFVYLEPPFHYLETARFFFLSQQTFVWTKTEEETEG